MPQAPVFTGAFAFPGRRVLNFARFSEARSRERRAEDDSLRSANMKTEVQTGEVMKEARRKLRMTQLALSRRVGCTESLITKIETGRCAPAHWLKEAIARELNIHTWEVGV